MPEVRLEHLKYGMDDSCVGKFQQALKNKGYNPGPVDDYYGNMTKDACARFQRAQGWSGTGADGIPGAQTIARLGLTLYGSTPPPTTPPPTTPPADGEPAHDYTRVYYDGERVNVRTRTMLNRAVALFGRSLSLSQGSYNPGGVGASAGTHDGGGVVDINVDDLTYTQMTKLVQDLRKVGFFAWLRTPNDGFEYHIHAVAIGDRELSSAARSQVVQGFNDTNGLANWGPDYAPDPYPAWTAKYGTHVSPD